MRSWFPTASRTGRIQVPVSLFDGASDGGEAARSDGGPDDETSVEPLVHTIGNRRTDRTFTDIDGGAHVTETVSNGRLWYGVVLAGLVFVLAGQLVALDGAIGAEALGIALGLCALLAGTAVATPTGTLPRRQVSLKSLRYPQLPLFGIVWAGAVLAAPASGELGVACSGLALATWLVHGYSPLLEDGLEWATIHLSDLGWRLPALPTRYVVTMATATSSLLVFALANTRLVLVHPTRVFVALVVTAAVVLWALSVGQFGWRARAGVLVAAATTGLCLLSLPLFVKVSVESLAVRSLFDLATFGLAAMVLLVAWVVLWYTLFSSQTLTRERFLDSGREISTARAAVAAYLMITTAGSFLCATLGTVVVAVRLHQQGVHGVIWLLGIVLTVPAIYLAVGSLYQLGGLAAMMWTIRARSDQSPSSTELFLPFDPAYPVWVLDDDAFYAGAYWDPLDRAIVISRGAITALDDRELAVIVAHEESHFEYRGAQLQFAFACLPAFALMGKNVVYSIYDFYERELTADAYALQRLDDAIDGDDASDILVGVLQKLLTDEVTPLEGTVLTFLPTLQTTPDTQPIQRVVDRLFHTFYGHFAGGVHPSNEERIRAIRAREDSIDDLSPTERPGDEIV
jgi:hypothetical protein